ncbi:MAG: hypothetical protein LBJ41_06340 [Treponema sp.]|jgi:hypothetical protein|nr:hypothetical protein [Treponema sp.]
MAMFWFARRRQLSILMVFTAISVVGTFSFDVLEPYQAVQYEIETTQDRMLSSVENFFIQNPAEVPVMFSTLGSVRFSPLRMSFQRISSFLIMLISVTSCSQSSFIASMGIHYSELKNTILLKLRI